jgi:hypothetical protein
MGPSDGTTVEGLLLQTQVFRDPRRAGVTFDIWDQDWEGDVGEGQQGDGFQNLRVIRHLGHPLGRHEGCRLHMPRRGTRLSATNHKFSFITIDILPVGHIEDFKLFYILLCGIKKYSPADFLHVCIKNILILVGKLKRNSSKI